MIDLRGGGGGGVDEGLAELLPPPLLLLLLLCVACALHVEERVARPVCRLGRAEGWMRGRRKHGRRREMASVGR